MGSRWLYLVGDLPVWDSIQVSPRHDRPFSWPAPSSTPDCPNPHRILLQSSFFISKPILIRFAMRRIHICRPAFCAKIGSWFVQLLLATKYGHKSHLGSNIWWSGATPVKYLVIKSLAIIWATLGEYVCVCVLRVFAWVCVFYVDIWERAETGTELILESLRDWIQWFSWVNLNALQDHHILQDLSLTNPKAIWASSGLSWWTPLIRVSAFGAISDSAFLCFARALNQAATVCDLYLSLIWPAPLTLRFHYFAFATGPWTI